MHRRQALQEPSGSSRSESGIHQNQRDSLKTSSLTRHWNVDSVTMGGAAAKTLAVGGRNKDFRRMKSFVQHFKIMEKPNPTFLQLLPAWQEETSDTRRTITRCGRDASGRSLAHLIDNYQLFQSYWPGQKKPREPNPPISGFKIRSM